MGTQVAACSAADVRRQMRSLRWKHPAKTKWPLATELAIARVQRATETPHSTEYEEIFKNAPIIGGGQRVRRKRSDGAINTGSMLCSAIASADLGNGLIGKPVGGQWQRKSWDDLGGLAFGQPIEGAVSEKRSERCAAELVAIGFVTCQQWRVVRNGDVRSEPGVKRITDKCWKALGVYSHVQRERRRRDRERKAKRAATVASLLPSNGGQRRPGRSTRPAPAAANPLRVAMYVKPPHEPPPAGEANAGPIDVKAHLDAFAAKMGLSKRS